MLAFAIIFAMGFIGVVISGLLGDLFDFLDHVAGFDFADVSISSMAASVALLVAGATGTLAMTSGASTWLAILAALVVGATFGSVAQLVINRAIAGDSGRAVFDLVGRTATATTPISPQGGEVRVDDTRVIEAQLAWADEDLPRGARVRVIEQAGSRLRVQPL